MNRRLQKQARDVITGIVADNAPGLVADGIRKLADDEKGAVASAVLSIVADFAEQEGPEAVHALSDEIGALIDGDPLAPMRIKADTRYETARLLSDLVDTLQDAEVAQRRRASRLLNALGIVLGDIGKVLSRAIVAAF